MRTAFSADRSSHLTSPSRSDIINSTYGTLMPSRSTSLPLLAFVLAAALPPLAAPQTSSDSLKSNFENPPASARPRVWWHWMNGNITKEGIKLDLEWMHRVGIAGFQNFDAAFATPQVVDHRLVYMTPEWKDAFKYATTLADQLGMEEAIAGSPGWSETGGPWVPPSQGMKKYVWSETVIEGGKPFTGTLAKPPSNTGAFQMLGIHEMIPGPPTGKPTPQFYADSVVVAYRPAASDVPLESLHPKFTASAGAPDPAILTDGDLEKTTKLPIPKINETAWVQYEFSEPQTMRSLTIVTKDINMIVAMITGVSNPQRSLEASDDGQTFREIARIPDNEAPEHTVSFAPVSAKFFRVVFKRLPPPPAPPWASGLDPKSFGFPMPAPPTDYEIAELVLHPGARVNSLAEKAAFVTAPDLYHLATPAYASPDVVAKSDVVDLTSKVHPDGTLDWTPPPGRWVVLRFGYSLLGITNHPATPEATGLEVDKLNSGYVKNYMNGYLDSYLQTVGPEFMGKRGIRYVITDSWEAGCQNWTDDILTQFKKRRGYDPYALDARADRASRRKLGSQRPVLVGLPQDHRRSHRRRALRPGRSFSERARHRSLRRIARRAGAPSSPTAWK